MEVGNSNDVILAAQQMAAKGKYEDSLALLGQIKEEEQNTELHFLKGKIYAQQGLLPDAIKEWEAVIQKNQEHLEARKALMYARKMQIMYKNPFFLRARLYYAFLFLALIFLGVLAIHFYWQARGFEKLTISLQEEQTQVEKKKIATWAQRSEESFSKLSIEIANILSQTQKICEKLDKEQTQIKSELTLVTKKLSDIETAQRKQNEFTENHLENITKESLVCQKKSAEDFLQLQKQNQQMIEYIEQFGKTFASLATSNTLFQFHNTQQGMIEHIKKQNQEIIKLLSQIPKISNDTLNQNYKKITVILEKEK